MSNDPRWAFTLSLVRRIDGFQTPLIPGGIEANVEAITSTTDCVTEEYGFSHPFRVNQIDLGHVISMLVPSECPKEGVRGPAAVDHERIDGFSNLLEHVRTHRVVYEILSEASITKNRMKGVNGLGAAHADLFSSNEVKFGQSRHAVDARIYL